MLPWHAFYQNMANENYFSKCDMKDIYKRQANQSLFLVI